MDHGRVKKPENPQRNDFSRLMSTEIGEREACLVNAEVRKQASEEITQSRGESYKQPPTRLSVDRGPNYMYVHYSIRKPFFQIHSFLAFDKRSWRFPIGCISQCHEKPECLYRSS